MNEKLILSILQTCLSPKRYEHSKRVGVTAKQLALRLGVDSIDDAYYAGLLHDIAKMATPFSTYNKAIEFTKSEKELYDQFPAVWHAFVGPKFVEALIVPISTEISDAIRYHTTGKANMQPLTACIYIADFIEPGRSGDIITYCRDLIKTDSDSTIFAVTLFNILKLRSRNVKIHPDSLDCYKFYDIRVSDDTKKTIHQTVLSLVS